MTSFMHPLMAQAFGHRALIAVLFSVIVYSRNKYRQSLFTKLPYALVNKNWTRSDRYWDLYTEFIPRSTLHGASDGALAILIGHPAHAIRIDVFLAVR